MKKVTGTQMILGGILLYFLLRKPSTSTVPVKPAPKPGTQPYTSTPRTSSQSNEAVAGPWEINCYHTVI